MAKSIYICSRKVLPDSIKKRLYEVCKKLEPDNISPTEPRVIINGEIAYGVMNPNKTFLERGKSLLMGHIFGKNEKWHVPLQEFPDGSYALFRDGEEYCEIVSDPAASRTIWYFMDENRLIASTSQRAIVMFIGSFEFDERVIPWMLSTGSLGPNFSWDKRIKRILPDSSIILNKKKWSISTKSNPVEFFLTKRSDEQHEKLLKESINKTFESLNINYSNWVLPLSGGYDSRGILFLLYKNKTDIEHLRTITWGLESSLTEKGNDACIAKELSNKLNVSHTFYNTDLSEEPIEKIINRFILLGEGRIDHLSGYLDGFRIWKSLFEDGIQGIIRGDEGFGYNKFSYTLKVRIILGCSLCSDFSNLKDYRKYGFTSQELPQHLKKRKRETINTWRDRLYHEYRLPTILSALSDLKFSYVEQINPLLSRIILQQVRQLPDHLRTEKELFRKIVIKLSPDVKFANIDANAKLSDILKLEQTLNLLKDELQSKDAKTIFPANFLDFVLKGIISENQVKIIKPSSFSLRSLIASIIPRFIKDAILNKIALPKIDPFILAFRVLLIIKMNNILNKELLEIEE